MKTEQEKIEMAAKIAYDTYCASVGGKAFNGDPLPKWDEFSVDEKKTVQANGWREAVSAVLTFADFSKNSTVQI